MKMHMAIAADVFGWNENEWLRFGSVAPDWFLPKPIHVLDKTYYKRVDRILCKLRRNFVTNKLFIGIICHYICDYCTYAHESKYLDVVGHRKYEVNLQEYFFENWVQIKRWYKRYCDSDRALYEKYEINDIDSLNKNIVQILEKLREKNDSENDLEWWNNEAIMKRDILMAYRLLNLIKWNLDKTINGEII